MASTSSSDIKAEAKALLVLGLIACAVTLALRPPREVLGMAMGWGSTSLALLLLRVALWGMAGHEQQDPNRKIGVAWLGFGILVQFPIMVGAATVSGLTGRDVLLAHIVGVLMVYSALVGWGLLRK